MQPRIPIGELRNRMSKQKRSELVRARRNRRTNKDKKNAMPRRTLASRTAVPMVSRGTMARPPKSARRRKEARRRYNVALNAPGAELRLPAFPVFRVGWRIVSGLLAVGMMWAVFALWTTPIFTVNWVEVQGLERLSDKEVNQVLKLAGQSVFTVDPQVVTDLLNNAFPELTDAHITVGLPAKVVISVGERQPILAWEHGGILSWVDENGIAFLPRGEAASLIPVRVMGNPPNVGDARSENQIISPDLINAIQFIAAVAPEGVTLLYHPDHGLGWEDPGGWMVFFGPSPDKMDQRMSVYLTMVTELQKRGITPVLISVEYLHAPYYRLD